MTSSATKTKNCFDCFGVVQQEEELEKEKVARVEKRVKARTHNSSQMVVDEVRRMEQKGDSPDLMPDDSDNNQEAEFEFLFV